MWHALHLAAWRGQRDDRGQRTSRVGGKEKQQAEARAERERVIEGEEKI